MHQTADGTQDDVQDLQRTIDALRASEQRYRSLFEHASDAIFIGGRDGRLVEANRRACELTGYTPMQLRGMRMSDLFTEADQQRMARVWTDIRDGEVANADAELRRADGSGLLAEVHVRHIDSDTVQAIVRDVTDRRHMEEALHRYAERLVSLHRLDQEILSVQSPKEVAGVAIESIRQLVAADRIGVLVFDAASGRADLLAAYPDRENEKLLSVNLHRSTVISDALRRREINVVRDVHMLTGEPAVSDLRQAGIRSLLTVPLVSQKQVIGMLYLAAREADAFSVEHIDVARETAVVLSLAVQSAHLFEEVLAARQRMEHLSRQLVRIQEEERRHLALELHDEIGQVLTALHLSLDMEEPGLPEATRRRFDKSRRIVEVLTGKVRNLSLDLRPTLLDDLGLLPALLWYVQRYMEQTGVQVVFRHAGLGSRRFPVEVETAAYRIVQEALTNVARHAGVGAASVQAWVQDDQLHLEIEDNGKGFSLNDQQVASSGLSGMRERARLAGGDLSITTAPGTGARVEAVLPLSPTDAS